MDNFSMLFCPDCGESICRDDLNKQDGGWEWQPIDTAPKDGTWIMLGGGYIYCEEDGEIKLPFPARYQGYGPMYGGYGSSDLDYWHIADRSNGNNTVVYNKPTHWMPLPEGPE